MTKIAAVGGMVDRLEFTKKVKLEIYRRAGGPLNLRCEGCGLYLGGKPFEIDHTIEEWERGGKHSDRVALTADDGKLLGKYCCHGPKSIKKRGEKAHGDRIIAKAARAHKKSTWRKKPDGYKFDWQTHRYVKED